MYDGYIKLHRRILDWDCYSDANTFRLFLHCLLNANWKDGVFKGVKIPRGNLVTSLPKLSQELRLTERQIRTAIEHLKTSGTIAVTTYSKFRIITVLNYEQYQDSDSQNDSQNDIQKVIQMTDKMSGNVSGMCQASDRQTTTIEELKKERSKEVNKKTYRSLVDEYTPDLDLRKALDDFVGMRKAMKGFTVRALELYQNWINWHRMIRQKLKLSISPSSEAGKDSFPSSRKALLHRDDRTCCLITTNR